MYLLCILKDQFRVALRAIQTFPLAWFLLTHLKMRLDSNNFYNFGIINSSRHAAFRMLLVINLGSTLLSISRELSTTLPCLSYVRTCPYVPYIHSLHKSVEAGLRMPDFRTYVHNKKPILFLAFRMWPLNEACHWCAVSCERKVQIDDGHRVFVYPICK